MKKEETINDNIKIKNKTDSKSVFEWISDLKRFLREPKINPIIAYLEKFDEYFKKKKRKLEKWEILFRPGKDINFYIIISWEVDIYRYTSDWVRKEIWQAKAGSFIWEWVIFKRYQKDVEAVANNEVEVFALDSNDLQKLESLAPREAMELYKHIIEVTNRRLLDSWKELADIYELTNKILDLAKNGEKWFFDIMLYINQVMLTDYIIFVENHPAISWFFFYKYSTELQSTKSINKKAWPEITENLWWIYTSKTALFWTWSKDSIYILPLNNNWKLKWYFIFWKKKWVITDNEIRISSHIWPLLGSVIDSNQNKAENKAIQMSKNYFDNGLNSI